MKNKFILLVIIITSNLLAQSTVNFFPSKLNVHPFTANFLEPKLGFLFHFSKNDLRLDIGNSLDILHIENAEQEIISIGADLFTYSLLRGEEKFHFPVDAIDYLFGLNASYKRIKENYEYGFRFRLSHISAHFVDGHYDGPNQQWRGMVNPIVYSREFIELMPFYTFNSFRVYAGITFIFHIDPAELGKTDFQIGCDYFLNEIFSNSCVPFFAYDLKLNKIDKYAANNTLMAGLKFGKPFSKGFKLYFQYYSGKNFHGEYYYENKKYFSFGLNLDL
ncbi:MAG: DUF1207 domain-containing protein [Ignavibacteria bacterium]|nr:DUF1207 domain-containing protein [Ignavibacteria bacterium]